MPEAAVEEHGNALPRDGLVGADPDVAGSYEELLAEPEPPTVQLRSHANLEPGVGPTVAAHHATDSLARRNRVPDASTSLRALRVDRLDVAILWAPGAGRLVLGPDGFGIAASVLAGLMRRSPHPPPARAGPTSWAERRARCPLVATEDQIPAPAHRDGDPWPLGGDGGRGQ